jgi:hypothetical protein
VGISILKIWIENYPGEKRTSMIRICPFKEKEKGKRWKNISIRWPMEGSNAWWPLGGSIAWWALKGSMLCGLWKCRNPSLGLTTKAKGLQGCGPSGSLGVKAKKPQGCGPKRSLRVTSHTPESIRKCEGVWGSEPSHSQGNFHFGRWSPSGLPNFHRAISGVKTQWLVAFFISFESS